MKDLQTVWSLTKAFTRRYFRDKVALFFTFAFPLIFLLIFGTIFGGDEGPSFTVAVFNNSKTEIAQGFESEVKKNESIKLKDVANIDDAKTLMGKGELDSILEIPATFGNPDQNGKPSGNVIVYFEESNPQAGQTFSGLIQGMIGEFNVHLIHERTPLGVTSQATKTAGLERFDYTLAGLIGFSMMSLGIFSMSEGFTGDKKAGALRRMQVAPIKAWQLILATAINRIFVGLISVAIMFVAALVIFDFKMRGDYLSFLTLTIISITCLFGFGMAIAGWARDANQAAPLTQIITMPMMFLSGVFFPTFLMPEWLQSVTAFIPLTPIIDGLRLILTESRTVFEIGPQLAVIGIWTLIIYIISFKVFRWE